MEILHLLVTVPELPLFLALCVSSHLFFLPLLVKNSQDGPHGL